MTILHKTTIILTTFITLSGISCSQKNSTTVFIDSDVETEFDHPETSDKVLSYLDSHPDFLSQSSATVTSSSKTLTDGNSKTESNLEDRYNVSEVRNLFNGKDLTGWVNETGNSPQGWLVKDGLLKLVDPQNGQDLLTKETFTNYVLTFEWRFGKECNSGVKYKIEQPNQRGWVGLEYQIQDDANVEDGKIDNRKIASLFDTLAAKKSSKSSQFPVPESTEPSGDFRQGKIVVFENQVEHWLDGEKVLTFSIGSNEWEEAKKQSKFKNQKNFGLISSSPILLQAHGYPIDFKSITIQTLNSK